VRSVQNNSHKDAVFVCTFISELHYSRTYMYAPGWHSSYSESWAGRSGGRSPVQAKFPAQVMTAIGTHLASCTAGTVFLAGKGRVRATGAWR
jgi:hypothetical protein